LDDLVTVSGPFQLDGLSIACFPISAGRGQHEINESIFDNKGSMQTGVTFTISWYCLAIVSK